jgi:hypothetical protein
MASGVDGGTGVSHFLYSCAHIIDRTVWNHHSQFGFLEHGDFHEEEIRQNAEYRVHSVRQPLHVQKAHMGRIGLV